MKTIKNKLFLATAILALASCADNTYLGDQDINTPGNGGAISFGSNTPSLTRTSSTDAAKLDYKFKVFGVKTVNTVDQRVFATATTGVTPYDVWFVNGTANTTTSNSGNWEYVGAYNQTYGTTGYQVTLGADQTIKYWDNSATEYNFQAWSDLNATAVNVSAITTNSMTLSATPAQLANFWISDLQTGAPASFAGHVVQFTFRKAATKVRLGIYETVPGYHVRNLKFKYTNNNSEQTSQKDNTTNPHAILNGKFMGNSTDSKTFTVSYATTTEKRPILTPSEEATKTTFFDFGEFVVGDNIYLGENSTGATWANTGATDHYTAVFPNTITDNVDKMTLKIDYELFNETSGEVIKVENKTAVVPATYMSWKPNYAYTYLFKITDDQLTPITLDAVVIDDGEGKQETITTVTDPSITTYAKASNVTGNGEYKDGATIYATVWDNALTTPGLVTLSNSNINLYTVNSSDANNFPITEASVLDAILKKPTLSTAEATAAKITYADGPTVTYGKTVIDYNDNTIELDNTNNVVASFTGNKTGSDPTFYAIVYTKTAATYTTDGGKNDYTSETFAAAGTLYTDAECTTKADSWTSGTTYYKRTAVTNKGTYAVKVIKVVP